MLLVLLLSLFATEPNTAHAQELPPPIPNQSVDPRLATVWDISAQDVCVSYPNQDNAWDLSPSITENMKWILDQRGSCMDQRGNVCIWNYNYGYLQVVFPALKRTYVASPGGDFTSLSGVVKHHDNPTKEGCFRARTNEPPPWHNRRNENPHHRRVDPPPPVAEPPPQQRASPN